MLSRAEDCIELTGEEFASFGIASLPPEGMESHPLMRFVFGDKCAEFAGLIRSCGIDEFYYQAMNKHYAKEQGRPFVRQAEISRHSIGCLCSSSYFDVRDLSGFSIPVLGVSAYSDRIADAVHDGSIWALDDDMALEALGDHFTSSVLSEGYDGLIFIRTCDPSLLELSRPNIPHDIRSLRHTRMMRKPLKEIFEGMDRELELRQRVERARGEGVPPDDVDMDDGTTPDQTRT